MSPNRPCMRCRHSGACRNEGLINRLALFAWLDDNGFKCDDFEEETFQGIEGCYA